ncbi:hypothetical protein J3F84DRAFT_68743 [Trichoderma pleuroticola]
MRGGEHIHVHETKIHTHTRRTPTHASSFFSSWATIQNTGLAMGLAFCGQTCSPLKRVLLCRTGETNDSHSSKFQGSNESSLSVLPWLLLHVPTHTVSTLEALKASKSHQRMSLPYNSPTVTKKPHLSQTQQINHQPSHPPPPPQHTVSNSPTHQAIKIPIPPKKRRRHSAIPAFQSAPSSQLSAL